MRSSVLFSLTTLGVTLATLTASSAEAQVRRGVVVSRDVIVCRDGSRFNSTDIRVCDGHRGVDARATDDARGYENGRTANGGWDNRRGNGDDRREGDDRDDRRNNGNDRGYGYGYGNNARREVYEWAGVVDKEIQIQLRGNRAWVQPIGEGDNRGGRGRVMSGMPQQAGTLVVQRLEGRGEVVVIEQPSARNGYSATVRVRDRQGGAARYRIVAYWEPAYGNNGRYGDNGVYRRN
jgi:hypothetical protein